METRETIGANIKKTINDITELFFLNHSRDTDNTKRKLKNNYSFCHEIRNIIDVCFGDIDACLKIENIVGNEDIISDNKFFEIIFNLFLIIRGLYGGFMQILINITKYFLKKPPEYTPPTQVIIANPISILNDDTPHNVYSGDIGPENIRRLILNNIIKITEISQTENEFKIYFGNVSRFYNSVKKLINIDIEIIGFIERDGITNMEHSQKMETRAIIIELFKSQIEIFIKLLCTMRTKIDTPPPPTASPPVSPPIARRPFMLPTRLPTGKNSISEILKQTLEQTAGPIGFRPMPTVRPMGGGSIEKIIYKEYKYLYIIHQYAHNNHLF
jgi:hypothetical protein